MDFKLVENENYSPLFEVLPFAGVLLMIVGVVVLVMHFEENRWNRKVRIRFKKLKIVAGYVFGIALIIGGFTATVTGFPEPVTPYEREATLTNLQKEIKTVYDLDLTTEEVKSLLPTFWVTLEHDKDKKFAQYHEITTLNSKNQISTIQLVQIKGEYQLVYADGEPTKLEELERRS